MGHWEQVTQRACLDGGRDRVDGQEHWQGFAVQQTLAHALDRGETEGLIEAHAFGLAVGDDRHDTHPPALFARGAAPGATAFAKAWG